MNINIEIYIDTYIDSSPENSLLILDCWLNYGHKLRMLTKYFYVSK